MIKQMTFRNKPLTQLYVLFLRKVTLCIGFPFAKDFIESFREFGIKLHPLVCVWVNKSKCLSVKRLPRNQFKAILDKLFVRSAGCSSLNGITAIFQIIE